MRDDHQRLMDIRRSGIIREKHSEVAWGGMIGMRHALVHGYFETNSTIVWRVVQKDLPVLKEKLTVILAEIK